MLWEEVAVYKYPQAAIFLCIQRQPGEDEEIPDASEAQQQRTLNQIRYLKKQSGIQSNDSDTKGKVEAALRRFRKVSYNYS